MANAPNRSRPNAIFSSLQASFWPTWHKLDLSCPACSDKELAEAASWSQVTTSCATEWRSPVSCNQVVSYGAGWEDMSTKLPTSYRYSLQNWLSPASYIWVACKLVISSPACGKSFNLWGAVRHDRGWRTWAQLRTAYIQLFPLTYGKGAFGFNFYRKKKKCSQIFQQVN